MSRNTLISRIHLAKQKARVCCDCGRIFFEADCSCGSEFSNPMRDQKYRDILYELTGERSCTTMTEDQLRKVDQLFDRAGFSKAYPYNPPPGRKEKYAVIRQIERRAKEVLGKGWEDRVKGFCLATIKKKELHQLNPVELRKVIGWINRLDKKVKAEGRKADEKRS